MQIIRHPIATEDFREHVHQGLSATQKFISPKFFYDERGSELFEQICEQPEYYIPKIETQILTESMERLESVLGKSFQLVEFGSGASIKTRIILEAFTEISIYLPIDISEDFLERTAERIDKDYPKLKVVGICADFTTNPPLPEFVIQSSEPILFFFPGSSLGNFKPEVAARLLSYIHSQMRQDDHLLIGVDPLKDKKVLEAAYNDKAGVTAVFNKNILRRLKQELGAELSESGFEHLSFLNEEESRIEMHLQAKGAQEIRIDSQTYHFSDAETIHTENSYKFSEKSLLKIWPGKSVELFSDHNKYFNVFLLKA